RRPRHNPPARSATSGPVHTMRSASAATTPRAGHRSATRQSTVGALPPWSDLSPVNFAGTTPLLVDTAMRSAAQLLYNFHWVVPGEAARAAQDYAGFLGPFLAGQGIAAIVNLRGNHPEFRWWRRETAICRKWGVAHFDAMLDSRLLPTRAMLAGLFDAFEAAPRPFLIKCSGGQDRTS